MTTLIVNIKDGEITNKAIVKTAFNTLADGKYKVEINEFKERSNPQNRYYWKVIVPTVKDGLRHNGWDEIKSNYEAHEYLKHTFLRRVVYNEATNKKIELPGTTTNLSTKEFNDFIEAVVKWGVEFLGLQIPFPNEAMIAHWDNEVNATIIQ